MNISYDADGGSLADAAYWPFRIELGVKVPMRDGVRLDATIYMPNASEDPRPVVVTITPYIADRYHDVAAYFTRRGFISAVVDCRGRGNSEGEFDPWRREADDGFDLVEWLSRQPFCDGHVGTFGASYSGKNQWAIAGRNPVGLSTIVPVASGCMGYDTGLVRNVPPTWMRRYLVKIGGRTHNERVYGDNAYWLAAFRELSAGTVSFRDFDTITGGVDKIWRAIAAHPQPDHFWDAAGPTDREFWEIRLPILAITGLYDDAHNGSLEFLRRHSSDRPTEERAVPYLVIGPWDHGGALSPKQQLGGLDFGPASVIDVLALHAEWYGWTMSSGSKPSFLADHFVYFVAGVNEWRSAPSLAAATGRRTKLYLSSDGPSPTSVCTRGRLTSLEPRSNGERADAFTYDPAIPGYNEGVEAAELVSQDYLVNDGSVARLNGDGLVYDSQALADGLEIVGRPRLELAIRLDVPDTDIRVQVFEVLQDGTHIFLCQDHIRARYRRDERIPVLVNPGDVEMYRFDRFPFVARSIAPESLIRVVISPLGASLHQQRNRNSGAVVADEVARDNRPALIEVMVSGESWLELPTRLPIGGS